MKYAGLILAISLALPLTTYAAPGPPASQPADVKEVSLGEKIIKRDPFVFPQYLRLEIGSSYIYVKGPTYRFHHVAPSVQLDYRLFDFLYVYAIFGTQYSKLSYDIPVGGGYTLTLGADAKASFTSGGGIRIVLYRHKRFRAEIFGQYQSLNESEAKPKDITLKWENSLKLDFTDVFKGHGYLDYDWRFVQTGGKLQFNVWRFSPYIVGGYAWLMFKIKIKIDETATKDIKLLTSGDLQKIIPERYGETRGVPILYIGTEFRVTKYLALNLSGMAYPAKEAIYYIQLSMIISH
jgi:hypothetical protein